jgi:flagellar motor switch/type III secretory pathway protein FliN
VAIEARLGERLMELSEIAAIEPGVVIPLPRAAGETLEVYVGDIRFALAEVVVIEDSLALRITKLDGLEPCLTSTALTTT